MAEEVIYSAAAQHQLKELIEVLYEEEYFGFLESAKDYVAKIIDFCDRIFHHHHRRTANPKYGEWYSRYSHSRKTHWFVFFDKQDDRYIIRHIINNYSKDYPQFIELMK